MSLSEEEMERRGELNEEREKMSGLNPRQSEELQLLEKGKWGDVNPKELLTDSSYDLKLDRVNRKDPYMNEGYEFILTTDIDGLDYVFTGEFDYETLTITPAELEEEAISYEPETEIRSSSDIYNSLVQNLNGSIEWHKLD